MAPNQSLILSKNPTGFPIPGEDLTVKTEEIDLDDELDDGSVLLKTLYLSYDPFIFYEIGKPKKGDVIFISAASGAVGQIVGQLAKREGLRVLGSVGSQEKLDFITKELGFDAGFNYRTEGVTEGLERVLEETGGGGLNMDEHQQNLGKWIKDREIKVLMDVTSGMEDAAEGFVRMLQGRNYGKAVLKLGDV
ncbi:putative NADP-dependent alkenal double bond reductase P2 [Glarea lozoyensis 74030]|uniref:Putative NADP-dependent alkenal double bond reductase P2 n=1 Tax=Glarea lozoyensis (strain ATCC 74030 / MF5533) TaxID=1104152 RepID=H0ER72_GLAL7|nr:putative NADP-dependent alkenal double bond reductase P2 [Glarea lozoyensis 74030]